MPDASADVLVVGSGIAGSLIATELARAGADVLILEAGRRIDRAEKVARLSRETDPSDPTALYGSPAAYRMEQRGPDRYEPRRISGVGGTTWSWAGASWRFLPADLRLRTLYGVGRDWPFGYEALEPFYARAEVAMGVAGPEGDDLGSPRSTPYPMALPALSWNDQRVKLAAESLGLVVKPEPAARNSRDFDGRPACCGSATCMPLCPTGALFGGMHQAAKAEAAGARLLPMAELEFLEVGAGGRITGARVFVDRNRSRIAVGRVVLAAGGIENARILLNSECANRSGQVGRNLMDHPALGVSFIANEDLWSGRGPNEMTSITSFRDGAFRSTAAAAKLHLSNAPHLAGATWRAIQAGKTGAGLEAEIRRIAARLVTISSFHEDLPDTESRLQTAAFTYGVPAIEANYHLSDYVKRGAARTRGVMLRLARAMGGAEIAFEPALTSNSHPMGTTIMGTDPATSVVDPDCRAHDHPNLYVAGSSVFPSASAVNPTLTITALALRLADSLKAQMR